MRTSEPVVLIADDEPDTCWALEHILSRYGAKCFRAPDGHSALQLAALKPLSLALLDAKLPDMEGLELARQIRLIGSRIPIVLVSGYFYRDDPIIRAALENGLICEFIAKPFLHTEIMQAVDNAIFPDVRPSFLSPTHGSDAHVHDIIIARP